MSQISIVTHSNYFTRTEWKSFWYTTLVSFGVYLFTLAPGVTLEDSGEFLTAAYQWGVPHPPGYPVWAISANLFERLIPFGNAAWRVNLMSAFYGALAVGMLSLMTCKLAGRLLDLERFKDLPLVGIPREALVLMSGMVAGLTFAFIDTMWSQAVITEVYTLNGFFFTALCLIVMRWLDAPQQWRWPCLMALVFGLGITNHQTLLISSLCFLFVMGCADRTLCRDTALLTAIASAILAWQSNLAFMWPVSCFLFYIYGYLALESPRFFSVKQIAVLVSSVLLAFSLTKAWWILALMSLFVYCVTVFSNPAFWNNRNAWSLVFSLLVGSAAIYLFCVAEIFPLLPKDSRWKTIKALVFLIDMPSGSVVQNWLFNDGTTHLKDVIQIWYFGCGVLLISWIFLVILDLFEQGKVLRSVAPFLLSFLMFGAGSSVYLYMPLSSSTNPPMNWGNTKTLKGFRHHITRGQYERIQVTRSSWSLYVAQYNMFIKDLQGNFSPPLLLLAVLPFCFFPEFKRNEKNYLTFMLLCFVFMGLVLVYLMNPKFDKQSMIIGRVVYSLAHGVYACWIGLGSLILLYWAAQFDIRSKTLIFGIVTGLIAYISWLFGRLWWPQFVWFSAGAFYFLGLNFLLQKTKPLTEGQLSKTWLRILSLCLLVGIISCLAWLYGYFGVATFLIVICLGFLCAQDNRRILLATTMVCALPLIPLKMNWADSELRGHDFGWRYGHDMLKNIDRDAVVYGGTDPGRFVPTFMIFVESFLPQRWKRDPSFDRRDLYIITQNALADETYMYYIRRQYDINSRDKLDKWYHKLLGRDQIYPKEPLRLPNEEEFNEIFRQVVESVKDDPNGGVVWEKDPSGKVMKANVVGLIGVFAINGGIARWIFENNKAKHSFYVEESYPIVWMYPYLEPAGLIMKLNKEPLKDLPPDIVKRDMEYWDQLKKELMAKPAFLRDDVARKSFSKLRSSIGGLYLFRKMDREAEKALKEAIEFYPSSSEAQSRLIEVYMNSGRTTEALQHCEDWLNLDPYNPSAGEVYQKVMTSRMLDEKEKELASFYDISKHDPNYIFQYFDVLNKHGKLAEADKILDAFLDEKLTAIAEWHRAIQLYAEANRSDRIEALLLRLVKREPKNALHYLNLAMLESTNSKKEQASKNLKKAIQLDTNLIHTVRTDERFVNLRNLPEFQKLIK